MLSSCSDIGVPLEPGEATGGILDPNLTLDVKEEASPVERITTDSVQLWCLFKKESEPGGIRTRGALIKSQVLFL